MKEITWIDYGHIFGPDYTEKSKRTFTGDGLNQPGTLVKYISDFLDYETQSTKEKEAVVLIGNVDPQGGVCGCCAEIRPETKILAYAIVWNSSLA